MAKGKRRGRRTAIAREVHDQRGLLDRIVGTPHLSRVVSQLPPEVLHRVIQTFGLEDCADLVALATPHQLQRVFDLDVWRTAAPGLDERFDPGRFGLWLEVLMASGSSAAAEKIAAMDVDLIVSALAQHVRVFDHAAINSRESADGDEVVDRRGLTDAVSAEIGGYAVEARRTDAWDTLVELLLTLDAEHTEYFHRAMRGCRNLSNSAPEVDGLDNLLDDRDQDMFDLALGREQRREQQGFVTPAQARAFLGSARRLHLRDSSPPSPSPIARAYFRAIDRKSAAGASPDRQSAALTAASSARGDSQAEADALAAIMDLLTAAGVVTHQPRALLEGTDAEAPRRSCIEAYMQSTHDLDEVAFTIRTEELGFLANAIRSGCSVQARAFSEREAADAAVAVCNLGLENWPDEWVDARSGAGSFRSDGHAPLPNDFLVEQDLVSVFHVGWTILHDDVCMYAAERLIRVLTDLQCDDRDIRCGLHTLRLQLMKACRAGTPWIAREAFDVIATLDMPAWASLLGLIDECPVIHAAMRASHGSGIRSVSATAFEFISENNQIRTVRNFLDSLPEQLRR